MTKKVLVLGITFILILMTFGCSSIQKGSNFNGLTITDQTGRSTVGHYNAKNWGIYVLSWGFITGDTENPNKLFNFTFGKTNVNVDSVGEMLTSSAKKDGATYIEDLVSSRKSMYFFPVFFMKSVSMSANGVK